MPVLVLVKDVEDIVGKLARVAEGEELLVYSPELGLVELSGRAVLQEALIPGGIRRIVVNTIAEEEIGTEGQDTIVVAPAYRLGELSRRAFRWNGGHVRRTVRVFLQI